MVETKVVSLLETANQETVEIQKNYIYQAVE